MISTLRFNVSYSYFLFQIIHAYFDVGYIDMRVNNCFKKSIILNGIYVAIHVAFLFLDVQIIFPFCMVRTKYNMKLTAENVTMSTIHDIIGR